MPHWNTAVLGALKKMAMVTGANGASRQTENKENMSVVSLQVELVDYGMNSVSQGIDAMAITRVVIRPVLSCSGVTPQVRTLCFIAMYACMQWFW